jgi:hypothetical protein
MGMAIVAEYRLERFVWRVLDRLDYWLTQARLWLADAVCGPEPETAADRQRRWDRDAATTTGGNEEPCR